MILLKRAAAFLLVGSCFLLLASCAGNQGGGDTENGPMDPEKATGVYEKEAVTGTRHMLVAANPHAARHGYEVLQRGGTVVDAAIAVQATLSLVEPQSSGIGGGAFIMYWDAAQEKLYTYDARETAPAKATPELFYEDGAPVSWREAIVGGRSVGVPGVMRGLSLAHEEYGRLPWSSLFESSAKLAEEGFLVSPRLAKLVGYRFHPGLYQLQPASNYFYPGGESLAEGTLLQNPDLAKSLRAIAREGVEYFYSGQLATEMVAAVANSAQNPGLLSLEDLSNYQVVKREPLCADYRQYRLCGMDQPSSGGLTVLQMFGLLEDFDMPGFEANSVEAAHLFTQASRLAFADRDMYSADADFVSVPVNGLLDKAYLRERARGISMQGDMGQAEAGSPADAVAMAINDSYELPSTSHMSIVDQYGNALSMTTSIEMAFGSSLMVGGFLLNNQLTDFSLSAERDGLPVANRVEAGKRPRSSMAPFVVFNEDGSLRALVGSPGGSRIINYVAKTLFGILDWELTVQEAIDLPNMTNRNDYTALEKGRVAEGMAAQLEALGHTVKVVDLNSGVHAISVEGGQLMGGADHRREGMVLAE